MRSRNALEFLRQWENDMNEEFDDKVCEELIHQGHTTSLISVDSKDSRGWDSRKAR